MAQYSSLNCQLIVWMLAFAYLVSLFKNVSGDQVTQKIDSIPEYYSIKTWQPELCLMSYLTLNVSHNTRVPYRHLRNTPKNVSSQNVFERGICLYFVESGWNVMAYGDAREGKWRKNWRMEWVASTLHTTSEHGLSSITTADAHTSAARSRLNWRPPGRFKWTRPFRRNTKSGFRACAITFKLASNRVLRLREGEVKCNNNNNNNNNNNIIIYLLQLGCHPVAVVILYVYKTWNWLLLNLSREGYMRSMWWQLGIMGTNSAFAYRRRETKKNLCRGDRSQDLPNTDF